MKELQELLEHIDAAITKGRLDQSAIVPGLLIARNLIVKQMEKHKGKAFSSNTLNHKQRKAGL